MEKKFPYTFTCDVCGQEFYSKVNPEGWRSHKCNKCAGKKYPDYPVNAPVVNNTAKAQNVEKYQPRTEFSTEDYVKELVDVYEMLKYTVEGRNLEIPEASLCQWATSVMIQKGKNNG